MTTLPSIAHLEDLRRALVEGGPALPEMTMRALLDTMGVGNKQAFEFLARARPDRTGFEAWIVDTAGMPDPDMVSRYNSWAGQGEPSHSAAAKLHSIDTMPDVLGSEQLADWERDGFVVVPDALPADHCAELAAILWDELGAAPDDPASWNVAETDGIMVSRYQHPAIERARRAPRIHKAFAQLWGTADLWPTTDRLGFNPPEHAGHSFKGSGIHWDVSLARPIPFATQGVLYLTDTAADQGAFRCVPGFHHRIDQWLDGLHGQNPRDIDLEGEAVCVPGKAGDLVIWRQDLPHGASPNRAATPRLVQYLNYYSPDLEVRDEWI